MPSIGWAEMMVMLVLALVVVGPRDLPRLLRIVGGWVRQVRSVAFDFQRQFDSMSRDMEIEELREHVQKLQSGETIKEAATGHIGKNLDPGDVDPDDLTGLPQSQTPEVAAETGSEPSELPEPVREPAEAAPGEGRA